MEGTEIPDTHSAAVEARRRLSSIRRQVNLGPDLTALEQNEATRIADRLLDYFRSVKKLTQVSIDAKLPGCGPILGGSPDLIGRDTSYGVDVQLIAEIKSVQRKFRSTDIRQLITYLVLYFSAHQKIPDVMLVVNPVAGRSLETGVDEFFEFTVGRSSRDVIPELLFEWSSAGISI